jgi:hypothetical protein
MEKLLRKKVLTWKPVSWAAEGNILEPGMVRGKPHDHVS